MSRRATILVVCVYQDNITLGLEDCGLRSLRQDSAGHQRVGQDLKGLMKKRASWLLTTPGSDEDVWSNACRGAKKSVAL
eukprot:s4550_g7.t1